ncbi:hypothetical protein BU24DRAFT_497780 [Aaosphaeria arxii CBS 175.79]|uniref:Ubiquinol-cytochrome c chaperone domain-containing protein n=1 Tax=Aaosphaeria arxii CBS 175.79 TaxID=1450172 RepID=A0A6A5X6J3_9PLEO|nr:uncharacterized protein BU24DRAFT_497780 [Aaosphaeria arxii CBS 175.79]KAF2008573.1 hypothetical protein BU24DRAFT_497780 [Aaosphaeria arxii CBS 175.79]
MASNYTCRACSRAIFTPSSLYGQAKSIPRKNILRNLPQSHRSLSSTASSSYHATSSLSAEKKPQPKSGGLSAGLAKKLREKAPLMTETYVAYGAAQELLKECAKKGDYQIPQAQEKNGEIPTDETGAHIGIGTGWWYDTLGLQPTFINWAQITFIHMYMLQVRFRMFPSTHAPLWIQHLTNHCFYAAEDRLVVWHNTNSNSLRQKYLKDIFAQWRAVLLSYDEALVKGDAWLAAALWRNLFAGREDVDYVQLAQIVAYMRRELKRLDAATDDEVANGLWKFSGDPSEFAELVKRPSKMMQQNEKA